MLDHVFQETVNRKLSDPRWATILTTGLSQLQTGVYPEAYQNAIFQKWDRFPLDLYDAYGFINVHTWLQTGEIAAAVVNVGAEPTSDKAIVEMNNRLHTLSYPFSARFWGGTQDNDGILNIAEPIEFTLTTGEQVQYPKACGDFPLEVGYTSAGKTMMYLNMTGGRLARWPYGSTDIILFARMTPARIRMEW